MTTQETQVQTRQYPARPKTERISGMWLREVRQYPGFVSMAFEDPDTLRRFTLEARKPEGPGEVPDQFVVYAGTAGSTGRGIVIDEVQVLPLNQRQPGAIKDGHMLAFTDTSTRCRYVCFENCLPPRLGVTNQPDWSATVDRSWAPRKYVRPTTGDGQGSPGAGSADPAADVVTEQGDIPY